MGRSSTSCFKIITCGSDSADNDDLDAPESKSSDDKRGWSFRKRSVRHRVLSNTVISETPSANKESPESATVCVQTQANSTIAEKTPGMQWADEKPQSMNLKSCETIAAIEDDNKVDVTPDESVIIVIQAGIRGFLQAQRALLKQKNIVKLQAAVRGHLVRRHAVGTLRCIQAIVKMQALVRARHARLSKERPSIEEKLNEKHGIDNPSLELLKKEKSRTELHLTYTSIEKLLSNRFARQLLESTPRGKPINIKCDPSKSDSAWKWLERWMSVSSTGNEQSQKLLSSTEPQDLEKVEHSECLVENVVPSDSCSKSTDSKSNIEETSVPSDGKENLITYDADDFYFQACQSPSSSVSHSAEQPQTESTVTPNSMESSLDVVPSQPKQSDSICEMELSSLSSKPEMESDQSEHAMKRFASEQPEIEEKKLVLGSRKASNPAFIAAQSKFEELSSAINSTKSISTSNQDPGVESFAESVSSATDNALRTREIGPTENSVSHISRVRVGGSECGTELSISSTLDSPDSYEVGGMALQQEANISEDGGNHNGTKSVDIEAKGDSTVLGTDLSNSISVQPEKCDEVNSANNEPVNSLIAEDSSLVEQNTERKASDMQIELEFETGHQVYKSSPEASPRSHLTVPESQGTPSSQVSVKTKKPKSEKSGSKHKPMSLPAAKSSFSNSNHDSGARSSLEQLPKDHKTGKRRNSFGSARPDHVDQEPRDSAGSGISLPNYMQATESARAKAFANSSPRSSPDVQDKDIHIKKRHSLPGANGRQGSPRIQRSPSQAQQSAKGNGTHPHGIS
ncbi:unnamed protein product [Ilex paraguariensis]|uniref:DUF4005 domain-containing protein n=1 Tax=Ilex paraguariensis TaxID=185542 RepID=A0ABC8RUK8_9AQUA